MSASFLGSQVGDYQIVEEIGVGATGWVYAARHVRNEQRVAVKLLRSELCHHPSISRRFVQEARAISTVGHPNIVQVFETGSIGELGHQHYIIMELLDGETLETRVERVQRLSVQDALPLFMQAADALTAAHERNIVHRDVKPENIFIVKRPDGSECVKLVDFGIAKLLDVEMMPERQRTERGVILGTPQYMSPEQCLSEENIDARSDIYSLALVLYRMLTGELPFVMKSHHLMRYVMAHTQETPRSPRSLVPSLSLIVEAVLLRALSKKREDRFPDVRAMAQALAPLRSRKETLALVSASVDEKLADALGPDQTKPRRAAVAVARYVLEGIHSGTLSLPSLPTAALRCIELLRSPKFTVAALVEVLGRDPLLASQVIGRANAAAQPGGGSARTIDQAIGRLGTRPLGALLIELSAKRVFESRDAGIRKAFQQLWDHSVAVAMVAQGLARELGADPELSYLAGLLHDVGKAVVGSILLEAERVAAANTKTKSWHSRDTWLELVSSCHREVAFSMARAWMLPDEVLFAISRSGRYTVDGTASPVNLVCLANALVKREGLAPDAAKPEEVQALIDQGCKLFALDDARVEAILEPIRKPGAVSDVR